MSFGKCLAARDEGDHSLAAKTQVTVNANFRTSSLLFVPCKIGSKSMKGLFDTGAEVTLADVSITDSERWIPAPYVNIPVTLDGTPLKIKGAVRATFEFQGVSVHDHLIYLVEGLGVSCLLGTDVMSRFPNGFILDFSRRSVHSLTLRYSFTHLEVSSQIWSQGLTISVLDKTFQILCTKGQ